MAPDPRSILADIIYVYPRSVSSMMQCAGSKWKVFIGVYALCAGIVTSKLRELPCEKSKITG